MKGSGGTDGGVAKFLIGFGLSAVATWLFLDSVLVTSGSGWLSGAFQGGWLSNTTSTGILFVPFVLGIIALFYDARKLWAWILMLFGLGVIVVEILSRVRFMFEMKTSHLLLLLALFGAGIGLMLASFREEQQASTQSDKDDANRTS